MQDQANTMMHLKDHMTYPATKDELVAACNNMSDFSEGDKKSFAETPPEGTYKSAEEVAIAIGLK